MNYRNFEIETFEVGRGLWHARFRRSDHKPALINGIELEFLDVGVAWPSLHFTGQGDRLSALVPTYPRKSIFERFKHRKMPTAEIHGTPMALKSKLRFKGSLNNQS
jgi:hypothetical protein